MIKISELFEVRYGNSLELNRLNIIENGAKGINFVSRTARNNGVSAVVEEVEDIEPFEAGLITVAVGGTVLETFIQPLPFYTGYHVMVLKPKQEMTFNEKLFYVMCIKENKYRYNYGRQANRTLKDILLPSNIPEWVYSIEHKSYDKYKDSVISGTETKFSKSLTPDVWKEFKYTDVFYVRKGKRVVKNKLKEGHTPFVGAIDTNNGIRQYCDLPPMFDGNLITVNYNGSVAEAFYQPEPFWASDDVNVLVPKFELNSYIAMFLITLIKKEKYRFNYGRKWHKERMERSTIKLPVDEMGNPDWAYMEEYIKSLPYSNSLVSV